MDIESIRTFLVLSNTKNFTRTANQLFVAQSTVTNRILELEKELNFSLFTRTNRSVELTPKGEQFLLYAEKVIELTNSSLQEISSSHTFEHHLHIGSASSIYEAHLAPVLWKHSTDFPRHSIKLTTGTSSHLLELLQDNILDVVFSYLPLKKKHFHCEIYKQDPLVLVTDIDNTKYKNGITRQQLLLESYLMCNFGLQDVGRFIRGLFPKYHQFSLELDDCSMIIPFLLGQNHYTFLPEDMATPHIAANKLRIIPLKDFQTPVINSYIIGKEAKKELWGEIFL